MPYPSVTQAWPKRYPSVSRNLVPRGKSDTEGRAQHLHLTPAGKSLVTKALKLLLATDAISMQHLSEGECTADACRGAGRGSGLIG